MWIIRSSSIRHHLQKLFLLTFYVFRPFSRSKWVQSWLIVSFVFFKIYLFERRLSLTIGIHWISPNSRHLWTKCFSHSVWFSIKLNHIPSSNTVRRVYPFDYTENVQFSFLNKLNLYWILTLSSLKTIIWSFWQIHKHLNVSYQIKISDTYSNHCHCWDSLIVSLHILFYLKLSCVETENID